MATEAKTLTPSEAAELIETTSADLCREHYGMRDGDGWLHGGGSHNDDRLTTEVEDDGTIRVRDGNAVDAYAGPLEVDAIREFVADWLESARENS